MLQRHVELALPALVVLLSLVALALGADRFISGAASLARGYGVPPLVVGMVIVGLGTSGPEMMVSIIAASQEEGGIAIGNVLGSNIGNLGLVLGIAALAKPMDLHDHIVARELPFLFLISLLASGVFVNGYLGQLDGVFLFVLLAGVMFRIFRQQREDMGEGEAEQKEEKAAAGGRKMAIVWTIVGLILLLGASRGVVWGGIKLALALGVQELVIGLTIVAIGTSLPELAAAVVSAVRGEHEMAVGNVIGSNMFNLLAVLPFPGLLDPGPLNPAVLHRDVPAMLFMTLLAFVFARGWHAKKRINRWEGGGLLLAYLAYVGFLLVDSGALVGD